MKRFAFAPFLSLLALPACGSAEATESEPGRAPTSAANTQAPESPRPAVIAGEANDDRDASTPAPSGCDPNADPTEDTCVVHETFGVFVSATKGSTDGDGTRAAPFAEIGEAILRAKADRKRVYACAETYRESVTLENGISVYGYFDCRTTWEVAPARAAQIAAPTSPAITAVDISAPTRLENVEAVAPDGVVTGASSIAMRAVRASALRIVNVRLLAGRAADGSDGVEAPQLAQAGDIDGLDALKPFSQFGCTFSVGCVTRYGASRSGGASSCIGAAGFDGGAGGSGGRAGIYHRDSYGYVLATRAGENGSPTIGTVETAQGAWPVTPARDGAIGAAGQHGPSATNSIAGLSAAGFTPSSGTAGTHGAPGQGGGGGRAGAPDASLVTTQSAWYGSSGSGGGAGGCPGLAGTAGLGGGASIALLSFDSPMRIERSELRASCGGSGGAGTLGSEPTPGGKPGAAAPGDALTRGGHGGAGGRAGVSGHGAGGPSIGIAQHGGAPTLVATIVAAGPAGMGRAAVTANDRAIPSSPDGITKATHTF